MIVQELAYKVTVKADEFLNGKKKVEQGVGELENNISRPMGRIGKQFSGLTTSVTSFGKAGKNAFHDVQLSAAKFLGIALTLEATRRLFVSTTKDLVQLGNMSTFLDMGTKSLDGFNKTAQAAGVSDQSMSSMLLRIKNAQNWMAFPMGAPDQSIMAMQRLQSMTGTDIIGAQDPGKGLIRTAEALRKLNKTQAEVMWGQMGGGADMFDLMYSGSLSSLQKDFEKRSDASDPAIKRAREVNKTLTELNQTVDNLGRDFVAVFGNDINEVLQDFDKWIVEHKDDIINFFKEGTQKAKDFADAIGGISNAMIILAGFKIGGAYGGAAATGYVLGDLTTPQSQRDLPNDKRNWLFRTRSWSEWGHIGKEAYNFLNENFNPVERAKKLFSFFVPDAKASEITPHLMDSIAMTESGGNPNAINTKSGAAGAYQLMKGTAADLGLSPEERMNPQKARAAASMYMRQLLNRYNGDVTLALMAYNAGPGRIDNWLKGKGKPLAQETINYPGKVLGYYQQMANSAMMPAGSMGGQIDNSQSNSTHIGTVNVYSNPTSTDQLTKSVEQQVSRSRITISFSGGNF